MTILLALLLTVAPQFSSTCPEGATGRNPGWCACPDGFQFNYERRLCVRRPLGMHMGTSYLVQDLISTIRDLMRERATLSATKGHD